MNFLKFFFFITAAMIVNCNVPAKFGTKQQPTGNPLNSEAVSHSVNPIAPQTLKAGELYQSKIEVTPTLPAGAKYVCISCAEGMGITEKGEVTWLTSDAYAGKNQFSFAIEFPTGNSLVAMTEVTVIGTQPPPVSSVSISVVDPGVIKGIVGEKLSFSINVTASDNSTPQISCLACFAGLEVDKNNVTFTPQAIHEGTHQLSFLAKSGEATKRFDVKVEITKAPNPPSVTKACEPNSMECRGTMTGKCKSDGSGFEYKYVDNSCGLSWSSFNYNRAKEWNITYEDARWEVLYDGTDSAADLPNHLKFDSAVDDDWDKTDATYRLNFPKRGMMFADRAFNTADKGKTANIWVRDPILGFDTGLTLEINVEIQPHSHTDGFSITYFDDTVSFGVHLSPDAIRVGDLNNRVTTPCDVCGFGQSAAVNLSNRFFPTIGVSFNKIRVVRAPNSSEVKVYVNDNPTPVATGTGGKDFLAKPGTEWQFPRILIGGSDNDPNYKAAYVLDYVKYRRGAFPPGRDENLPYVKTRTPPPLPAPMPADQNWFYEYKNKPFPFSASEPFVQFGDGAWKSFPGLTGVIEYLGMSGTTPGSLRFAKAPGLEDRGAFTYEARIKVLPDSEDAGFVLAHMDPLGSIGLALSTDKAEFFLYPVNVGRVPVKMNTTDDFHTYRIVRPANSLYAYLYIDDNPIPAIADYHLSGELPSGPIIWFGDLNSPIPKNGAHVLIDYVRWMNKAYAPAVK